MRKQDIYFRGRRLSDFGAVISDTPSYTVAVRELDFTSVPGKSGDIITDKKRFKNMSISYKISHVPTWDDMDEQSFVDVLTEWLLADYDYCILRDSMYPGYFRRAVCTGISKCDSPCIGVVTATVTFNCMPFWYSDSGTVAVTKSSANNQISMTIRNREKWESEPVIRIIGSGNFTCNIAGVSFEITDVTDEITIDKPQENVYNSSGSPCNDKISAISLPSFAAGDNNITIMNLEHDFVIEIIPNWRRL